MTRLAALALLVAALAGFSACGGFHLVERQPVPPMGPRMSPPAIYYVPTVTPTPVSSVPCHKGLMLRCDVRMKVGEA